ncbi:MAG: tail fiber domain-containing protein [Candidatus Babeliales bacterium]
MINKNIFLLLLCAHLMPAAYTAESVNTKKMQTSVRRHKLTIIPRLAVYSIDAKVAHIHGPATVNGSIRVEGTLTINGHPLNPSGLLELPLSIANGGTNATVMTNTDGVVYFDGSSLNTTDVGTAGQLLTSHGPGQPPTFVTAPSIITIGGNAGTVSGTAVTIQGGNNITTTGDNNSTMTVNIAGTTNHAVQLGNSTGSLSSLPAGATNTVLLGNTGAAPSFGAVPNAALANSSITVAEGTGISITGGSSVSLGGTATINVLIPVTIANGGTNATSMTNTNGVLYYDGTLLNTTTVGAAGQLLTSNGTGSAPTFQAFTITNDSGSVTGNSLSLTVPPELSAGTTYCTLKFSGSGTAIAFATSDSNGNTVVGDFSGYATMGSNNTVFGEDAMSNYISGLGASNNCVFGQGSLVAAREGSNNCVFGRSAARSVLSGSSNIIIGAGAGNNLAGSESNNIYIGSAGQAGDNNALRIGDAIEAAYIGGINGATVLGAIPLFISADNEQLGTVASSRVYKKNIQDIDAQTARLLELRPVTFNYKKREVAEELHFGLIAEEAEEVIPALVVRDKNGEVQTVKYQELPVILLVYIKQLVVENIALKKRLAVLEEFVRNKKGNM